MTIPLTLQQALDVAEKARTLCPALRIMVAKQDGLEHADLAYSALILITDQLRDAETYIQALETQNDRLIQLITQLNNPTSTPTPAFEVRFQTDTATFYANQNQIIDMVTDEIVGALQEPVTDFPV